MRCFTYSDLLASMDWIGSFDLDQDQDSVSVNFTKMTLKHDIMRWQTALDAYRANNYAVAVQTFQSLQCGSKIHFNLGQIYMVLGRHEDSIICFKNATIQDQFLSIAHFQHGIALWILGRFSEAVRKFTDCLNSMRGCSSVDYHQLGLKYKLFAFEVTFNRILALLALNDLDTAQQDLTVLPSLAELEDHKSPKYTPSTIVSKYQQSQLASYLPFSVPEGTLYEPTQLLETNVRDFLGSSKVIASIDPQDRIIGFSAPKIREAVKRIDMETTFTADVNEHEDRYEQLSVTESQPSIQDRRPSYMSYSSSNCDDMVYIKVKHNSETRVVHIKPSYQNLKEVVAKRFGLNGDFFMKYTDEDEEEVTLGDDEDLCLALEGIHQRHRQSSPSVPSKLTVCIVLKQ